MKKTDLKPGALLAAKHISGPVRLLSTDLFTHQYGHRDSHIRRAPEYVTKPKAAPRSRSVGFDVEGHGYLVLARKRVLNRLHEGVDVEEVIRNSTLLAADMLDDTGAIDSDRVPGVCELRVVTSLTALLGDYDAHVREVEEQRHREQARQNARERQLLAVVERHNRLAAALSAVLDTPISPVDEYAMPTGIRLTFEQAEQLAKALGPLVGDDTTKGS